MVISSPEVLGALFAFLGALTTGIIINVRKVLIAYSAERMHEREILLTLYLEGKAPMLEGGQAALKAAYHLSGRDINHLK